MEKLRSTRITDTYESTDSQDTNKRLKVEGKAGDECTRKATWVSALGLRQQRAFPGQSCGTYEPAAGKNIVVHHSGSLVNKTSSLFPPPLVNDFRRR